MFIVSHSYHHRINFSVHHITFVSSSYKIFCLSYHIRINFFVHRIAFVSSSYHIRIAIVSKLFKRFYNMKSGTAIASKLKVFFKVFISFILQRAFKRFSWIFLNYSKWSSYSRIENILWNPTKYGLFAFLVFVPVNFKILL